VVKPWFWTFNHWDWLKLQTEERLILISVHCWQLNRLNIFKAELQTELIYCRRKGGKTCKACIEMFYMCVYPKPWVANWLQLKGPTWGYNLGTLSSWQLKCQTTVVKMIDEVSLMNYQTNCWQITWQHLSQCYSLRVQNLSSEIKTLVYMILSWRNFVKTFNKLSLLTLQDVWRSFYYGIRALLTTFFL